MKHIEFEDLLKLFRRELELKEVHTYKQHLNTCDECSNMLEAINSFETIELIQPQIKKHKSLFDRFSCGLKYMNAVAACFLLISTSNIFTNQKNESYNKIPFYKHVSETVINNKYLSKDKTSEKFKKCSNISKRFNNSLSLIAGGNSRNNRSVRVNSRIVHKLKPHAVLFDGDMDEITDQATPLEWQRWFEDWQHTMDNAKRVIETIPKRGNHEPNENHLIDLFGTPASEYYSNNFRSGLVKIYTINSKKIISEYGPQTTWLINDLDSSGDALIYKFAQYHTHTRSHIKSKLEAIAQYSYWSNIFYSDGFDVIAKADSHTSKITHFVILFTKGYNYYGEFKQDDNGTVYIGEGCWGVPLRSDHDTKMTKKGAPKQSNSFSFNHNQLEGILPKKIVLTYKVKFYEN